MKYLMSALLLALLGSVIAAEDPAPVSSVQANHKVRLVRPRGDGIPVYQKDTAFSDIFNGDVRLIVENNGTEAFSVQYEVFVDSRCYASGSEISVDAAVTIDVPAGGANISLPALTMPDVEMKCGPACLFVNVTGGDKLPGVGRVPMLSKCDNKQVDLQLTAPDLDEDATYSVELGKNLVDQLPSLNNVKLKNLGPDDVPDRATEFAQSVLVFVRKDPYTQKEFVDKMTKTCVQIADEWYSSGEYTTTESMVGRRKRSQNRKKRSADELDLPNMFEMWKEDQMRKRMLEPEDIPRCLNKMFGAYDRDVPLVDGDVIIGGPLAVDDEETVDLAEVKLEAYRKSLCTDKTRIFYEAGNMHRAQLFLVADPIGMNNDSNLCNNALMVNITYDCTDFEDNGYEMEQCDVVSDPMSRGHLAAIFHRGDPVLYFNGKNMEYMTTDEEECKELDYYLKLTEVNRWYVLALRLQSFAESNPQACKAVENYEKVKDRMLLVESTSDTPKSRKKRGIIGPSGGDGQQVDKAKLIAMVNEIFTLAKDNSEDMDMASRLYCNFTKGITFQYNILGGDSLAQDDDLRRAYEETMVVIEQLDSKFHLLELGCSGVLSDSNLDKWMPNSSGDSTRDDAFDDVLRDIDEKRSMREGLEHADFDMQKDYIFGLLKDANMTCPGGRGRTSAATATNKTEQAADLVEKASDSLYESPMVASMDNSSCGRRLLDTLVERGIARFINHDLRKVMQPYTDNDDEINLLRYLKFAAEVVEDYADRDDLSMDEIKESVDAKMDEALAAEEDRCGVDSSAMMEKHYQADDVYTVFWKLKDGKVYRGIPDVFDGHFGADDGAERKLLWTQVATCSCSNCDRTYSPDWQQGFGGYNGYGYGGSTFEPGMSPGYTVPTLSPPKI